VCSSDLALATGRITGVVTTDEAQPRPLRRARVTLNGGGLDIGWSVITNDDGTFAFDRLPAGRYGVAALKDGYVTMNYGAARPGRRGTSVQVAERQTAAVTLRLPRGAVITGTVLDVDGQPAEGISVGARARRFNAFAIASGVLSDVQYVGAGAPVAAITNDRGVYRIYGLPAGEYVIAARPASPTPSGSALTGTLVQMMSQDSVIRKRMLLSTVYHPAATDVARASVVSVRAGEERSGIDVQLEYVPVATVRGTLSPLPGAGPVRVALLRQDAAGASPAAAATQTDSQGRFEFSSVSPGAYRVMASGYAQVALADIVVNGDDLDVPLALQPALSISGEIKLDGAQSAGVPVPSQLRVNLASFVMGVSSGWPMPAATIDGSRFTLDGIVPGIYRLSPNGGGVRTAVGTWWLTSITGGGRELLDAPLDIERSIADAVITFSDRASAVSGTVRDGRGAPSPDAWIVVCPADRAFWFNGSRRIAGTKASAQGAWTIRNLPPGEYRIVATTDLDQGEWFDPAVLERLQPNALPLTMTAAENKTIDLLLR